MQAITTDRITKCFGKTRALNEVTLSVDAGSIFGIIGPDGAGKSTLVKTLSTLVVPDSGSATVCGHDLCSDFRSVRQKIGYMPELFSLYQDLTVWENLTFYASLFNVSIDDSFHLIRPVFKQLEPFKKRKAGKLSGGMKQKLALSCALIHRPELLLLDEPTRGVDPVSRKDFWQILSSIKEQGITILLSTSYMDEAMLCDRIGLFDNGKFLETGTPDDIIQAYRHPLFSVKSNDLYTLLLAAKNWEGTKSCYTFGDSIHLVLHQDFDVRQFLLYAEETTRMQVLAESIKPTIEDCFMNLIENGQNN